MTPTPQDPTGALARARQRAIHRDRCVPDPARPEKRINPEPDCPHGTEGGYTNWGCECRTHRAWHLLTAPNPPAHLADPPRDDERPGCEPAAVAAVERRRQQRSERPE